METKLIATVVKSKDLEQRWNANNSELKYEEECTFAIEAISKNTLLQKCITEAKDTIQMAVYKVSILNISLNPVLGFAYLIPRYNSSASRMECSLDISYKGMIDILTKTGGIKRIYAYLVYEGDTFEVELGSEDPTIKHKPSFMSKTIKYCYAVAVLPDGEKQFDIMRRDELDYIKSRSESGKKDMGPWKSDYGEQCRKTVIRRLWKTLPKNDATMKAFIAVGLDNENQQIDFAEEQARMLNTKKHEQVTTTVQKAIDQAKGKTPEQEIVEGVKEQMALMNSKEETIAYLNGLPQETKDLPEVKKLIDENK